MYSRLAANPAAQTQLMGHPVRVVFSDYAPRQKLPYFDLI